MKNLRKSLFTSFAYVIGLGGVFSLTPEQFLWRADIGGITQDITSSCTYNAPTNTPKCSAILHSFTANGDYFMDPFKLFRVSKDEVYVNPDWLD